MTPISPIFLLLAVWPNGTIFEAHGFGLDRRIEAPLRLVEGMAVAPDRPGHGMVFDWKGLVGVRA